MNKMTEEQMNKKAEEIYSLQRKIDALHDEIYDADELWGDEIGEVLKDNLY